MPVYRVYLTNPSGGVDLSAMSEFDDDQAAITHGLEIDRGARSLEIWCEMRLVTVLAPIWTRPRLGTLNSPASAPQQGPPAACPPAGR